jgi:glyoxylase-like metal-dependent hydrolase (beta-lactamase superfamily II)
MVIFTKANVVHMGDVFVTNRYPFVDLSSGGNANGIVAAADRVLTMCNSETKVIPGHGTLSDCATLRAYRDMVATVRERVQAAMRAGKSLDAIRAAKLTAEFDTRTRGATTVNGDQFVEFMYRSLGGR